MVRISKISNPIVGEITLKGSKSISNRALIIQALCEENFAIQGLAQAEDTELLATALNQKAPFYDVNHAGTSSRFLAAYLCLQEGEQILTGSESLKKRPIKPLIDALISLGANIEYVEEQGHLPVKIGKSTWTKNGYVEIAGDISSQYISALLLIAPALPYGLSLKILGELVSRPYLEMTLKCMSYFGITYDWSDDFIHIKKQSYQAKDFVVEADWSAASYYFSLVGAIPNSKVQLNGLFETSMQGDAAITSIMEKIGVKSTWKDNVLTLEHIHKSKEIFEYDFILCPDLAQTVIAYCASQNITGLFTGLKTLKIKETDRITALQKELQKVQVFLTELPKKFSKKSQRNQYLLEGKTALEANTIFATYHDHRMAMSLSVLATINTIQLENPDVIKKSYPGYWKDLQSLGIEITWN